MKINEREKSISCDFSFGSNYQFLVNTDTGITCGLGIRGWIEGTVNNIQVKVSIAQKIVLETLSMNDYSFGTYSNYHPRLTLAMGMIVLVGVMIVCKKRR